MGGGTGGFPVELILFGMIAAFLVLRLRGILGRRQGFERPPEQRPSNVVDLRASAAQARAQPAPPVIDGVAEPLVTIARVLPEDASAAGRAFAAMRQVDPSFNPTRFLEGAEAAFRLIVQGFAAGDRGALRPLLTEDTFHAFDGAIAGRETARETQRTEIRAIGTVAVDAAELRDRDASITVRFVSDQVNVTLGPDGNPVAGADALMEITDLWTFERALGSQDPAWRLAAARSA